jgi:probable rRNA maturation factor
MSKISFFEQDIKRQQINRIDSKRYIENLIRNEKKRIGEISIILCSDEYLLTMNRQYLDHNYLTDVITFDYCENDMISGDIFISVERVKENALIYGASFLHELYRVIFHGVLHLVGYGDKVEEEFTLMRNKENYYLNKFIQ